MFIDCSRTDTNAIYKVLIGAVVPRPIAWVSTMGKNGISNLAPFSFFNCFGVDPPMVGFAPGYKSIAEVDGKLVRVPKDTLRNIEETQEFVINIVTMAMAEKMNQTSADWASEISEFDAVGVAAAASQFVAVPRVSESPVNLECRLIEVVRHGNNNLVLGEILGIRVNDDIVDARLHIDAEKLQAVGRMSGSWYATTRDRFELKRPQAF